MGMLAFMLVLDVFGYERWKIVRHLSECFLGTRPKGEITKFLKGGGGRKGKALRFDHAGPRLRGSAQDVGVLVCGAKIRIECVHTGTQITNMKTLS